MVEGKIIIINALIIVSLIVIYVYEANLPPEKISIKHVGKYVGKYVVVRGIVLKKSSSKFFVISDEEFRNKVGVYDSYFPSPSAGSQVNVAGVVKKSKTGYEIIVQRTSDLKILKSNYETTIPVIMSNPQQFVGFNISVSGKILFTQVKSLTIMDGSGTMNVICRDGYSGPRHAYFLVKYRHGEFFVDGAYSYAPGKIEKISAIRAKENHTYLINSTIEMYGIYGIIGVDGYNMRFTMESEILPQGMITLTGRFDYDAEYGEYILHAGNVK